MSNEETESLPKLAHDAGEADALWFHQLREYMSDEAKTAFIRAQGRGGFVPAMSHGGGKSWLVRATGDLALAWQMGFESTLAWLDGKGQS